MQMKRLAIILGVLAGASVLIAGAIAATRPFATASARGPRPPIRLKGPTRTSTSQAATFRWSRADTRTSGFRCRLDRGRFTRCKSGITYKQLRPGTHTFTLVALDAAGRQSAAAKGNTKSSPPSWSWTVAKAQSTPSPAPTPVPSPPSPGAAPVKGNQTIAFTKPADKSFGEGSTTLAASASSGLSVSFSSKTTSVCTASGPNGEKVSFLATGTCTIAATQAGDSNWNAATAVEQSFTIAKGNQTIAFTAPTEKRLDQSPITLTATTTSGLPVSFESKTTSVCTTSGANGETVTSMTAGTCTIRATQAGNSSWNAAPTVEQSFTIAKGNQAIAFAKPADKSFAEGTTTIAATASSSLTVDFESKTTSVCATSGTNGETVTFLTTGTCTIKATQAGNSNWNAAPTVEQSFAIGKGTQTITFTAPTEKRLDQNPITLAASATSGLPVSFESKTTSVCTTSGANGETVTSMTAGTCTIRATQAGNSSWNAAPTVEQSFTIAKGNQMVTFAKPADKSFSEGSTTIAATASSGLPVSFNSKTTSVCTTSGPSGEKVAFVAAGTCTIAATQAGNSNWNAAPTVEQSFIVAKGNQTIAFTAPTEKRLDQSPITLTASATSGLTVNFESQTTSVCTTSGANGETVVFLTPGTCTIAATQAGNFNWNAAPTVEQSFTVAKGNQAIAFAKPANKSFSEGSTTIEATASSGLPVDFESQTTSVCATSGIAGETITFLATGTCTIKATQNGDSDWNAAPPVEQSFAIGKGTQTITFNKPADKSFSEGSTTIAATATSGLPVSFNSKTTSVCTTSGPSGEKVAFVAAGTCTIEATQGGDSDWGAAAPVTQSFAIAKGNQTITFNALSERRLDQSPLTVTATATSGLPVSFEAKTTGVCTTSGATGATVTLHTTGTCTIAATQAGNANWNAATAVEQSFTVAKGDQTIAFEGVPAGKRLDEGPITLKAKASSGLPVTFESQTTSVCTTSGTSGETVNFVTAGSCTIKASQAGNTEWNPTTEEQSLTITKGNQAITFNKPPNANFNEGSSTVEATASSGLPVTFEAKTTSVCTTSGTTGEKVSFLAAGTCTIKATQNGNTNWNAATAVEQSFTIAKGNQTIAFNKPADKSFSEGSTTVEATATSGLPVSFNSKTTSVCTTSGPTGEKVSFLAAGTCTIEATQTGNANWNAATAVERSFTVARGNQTITFTAPTEKRLDQNPITVTATATSGLTVNFESTTMSVCTTSGTNGETLTFHTTGTCTIKATQAGNANWNAAPPVERSFTVAKGNQTITFEGLPASKRLDEGPITLKAKASSGLPVTFSSTTTSVCTTSGTNGETLTFHTTGTCTIKASQAGNTEWNPTTEEQSLTITKGNQTITFNKPPNANFAESATTIEATASSGLPVTFEAKTTSVCTTSGVQGEIVTFAAAGTCTIKATQAGNTEWNPATAVEQSFTIAKASQTITFNEPSSKNFAEGSTTLTATASSGLAVTLESRTTGVCTVSGAHGENVTFVSAGACTIKATQGGNADWNAATAVEQSFTIAKGNQTITFTAPTEKRLDQSPLTVTATATSGLPVSFNSKTTGVCTIVGETVTFHSAGTCTLEATQAGNANWNVANPVERSFTVAKGNQSITFNAPTEKRLDQSPITLEASTTSGLAVSFEAKTTSVCTTSGVQGETVTFLTKGTCTIKATQAGSANWNAAPPVEQSFTIAKGNQTIAFEGLPASKRLDEGPITLKAKASSGLPVTFSSTTKSVCTTSGTNGETITFHTTGTCTIKASQAGNTEWNPTTEEQSLTITKGNQTITFAKPPNANFNEGSSTVEATASSGLPVSFEAKTTSVCTTSGAHGETVTFAAAGTCTIKASQAGNTEWNPATAVEQSFTIAKGNQTITFTAPAEKRLDQSPITVTATTTSGLTVNFESTTTSVCTTSGTSGETVTLLIAGTCTIKASQAGNANWNAATAVERSFTVAKGNQTITFKGPTEKRLDQSPVTVEATASSGLAVGFNSKTTGVCTIVGETVTLHAAGTCTIEATQSGSANWNAATAVSQSFTVAKGNQTITFNKPADKSFGEGSTTLAATASSGLAVTFESKTSSICTVSGANGEKVAFVTTGTCTIKASQAGSVNWNAATPVEQSFAITSAATTLTALSPPTVAAGEGTSRVVVSPDGKNVYATNRGGGGETISQYSRNAETGKLTALVPATVATGAEPEDVVVSPDGTNVYVANRGSDTISRYSRNGTTGALTAQTTVATGEGPIGLAITPDGKQVYAANAISATVSQFSRNTGTGELKALATATVAAGTNAHGIDVSPDGKNVYVANYGADTVSEYARNEVSGELTVLGTATGGSNPHDLDISPDGANVYVADSTSPGEVLELSRNTETGVLTALTTIVAGEFTECIVVSPDGNSVYATNEVTNNVSQYSRNTETGELTALTPAAIAAGTAPEGIDVSPDSKNVYVANHESGSVSQYSR